MKNRPSGSSKKKLFQILQKLSSSQLTKLLKLIESPYFHQTSGVVNLFKYLRKFHPQYPVKKVADETIAQQLFPGMTNGPKKVMNFKSDLMKLIERFLILQTFSQQKQQQQFLLAQAYQELELPDYASSSIKKLTRSLQETPARGLPYLHQKMQLTHFQYYHPERSEGFKNQQTLQDLLNQLDHYFISAKYKYGYEASERMSKRNEQFDLRFWEETQSEAVNFGGSKKESSIYYYRALQHFAIEDDIDELSFTKLKTDFFKNQTHLDQEDRLAIYRYLLNCISKNLNRGATQLAPLQFELYKDGLSNNLLIWKNRIPTNTFLNVVVVASTCKAFDWLENFISNHQSYLSTELQEDVLRTATAISAFHQEDTAQVLTILNKTQFKNQSLELFCFPLEVKSLFEVFLQDQTYYITILSKLDGLAKKVSTKYGFAAKKKEGYLNYIHFVQQLVKSYNESKNNIATIKGIRTQITSTNHLIHKSWLLEKCDQMIKTKNMSIP